MSAPLLPLLMLVLVSAITPGPNNLIVLRTASRGGWVAALPAILGVVLGGLVLVLVVVLGIGAAFARWPWVRTVVAVGGGLYLMMLGVRLMWPGRTSGTADRLPAGWLALATFQFLNPKGWVMVLTVAAAMPASSTTKALALLVPAFTAIPLACLLLWAVAGGLLSRHLARPAVARRVDRLLGGLLVACAALLFI